jgi:hypothetical protein
VNSLTIPRATCPGPEWSFTLAEGPVPYWGTIFQPGRTDLDLPSRVRAEALLEEFRERAASDDLTDADALRLVLELGAQALRELQSPRRPTWRLVAGGRA